MSSNTSVPESSPPRSQEDPTTKPPTSINNPVPTPTAATEEEQEHGPSHAHTDPSVQTKSAFAERSPQEIAQGAPSAGAAAAPPALRGQADDDHEADNKQDPTRNKIDESQRKRKEKERARRKPTLQSFSLQGKVGVITGGAGGLGLVMASALLESGARVAIVDLNVQEAEKQAQSLNELYKDEDDEDENHDGEDGVAMRRSSTITSSARVTAHAADVSSPSSLDDCISHILTAHGQIDILITAAGFTENFPALSYPYERMQKLWAVNVDGTYLAAVAVAKHLMERDAPGSIIFIGSMSGAVVNVPQPQAPYNASKAAVRHLAASLAVEWAPRRIRVNCISPGYMETNLTKKILSDKPDLREKWTSLVPQGRLGDPTDLKGAVVFLASDASAYVTGADLRVDGGYTVT